jgi:hypothetical protein
VSAGPPPGGDSALEGAGGSPEIVSVGFGTVTVFEASSPGPPLAELVVGIATVSLYLSSVSRRETTEVSTDLHLDHTDTTCLDLGTL